MAAAELAGLERESESACATTRVLFTKQRFISLFLFYFCGARLWVRRAPPHGVTTIKAKNTFFFTRGGDLGAFPPPVDLVSHSLASEHELEELLARLGVLPEHSQHAARDGLARHFLHAAHHHTHVPAKLRRHHVGLPLRREKTLSLALRMYARKRSLDVVGIGMY